jgi:glutaredoxin
MTKNAIVWTNSKNLDCRIAVGILKRLKYTVEERNIDTNRPWSSKLLTDAIPGATTVPQIVIDETVIGGLEALKALPEVQATKPAPRAANAPRTKPDRDAAKISAIGERINAANTEWLAKQEEKAAAILASRYPAGMDRAQRRVKMNADIQDKAERRAAAGPAPRISPEGKISGAPKAAPAEHHEARYVEDKAKRDANKAEVRAAKADTVAAARVAHKARVAEATAAQIAARSI